jgi:hypothetical protein
MSVGMRRAAVESAAGVLSIPAVAWVLTWLFAPSPWWLIPAFVTVGASVLIGSEIWDEWAVWTRIDREDREKMLPPQDPPT